MEIVINNLSKNYGKKSALKNVSVTIHSGMYGLLGRNGAGKTSLMRILATLSVPSSGEISMNGIPIKETTKIREIVGYLPQDFSFYRNMSVYGAMDYLGLLSNIPDKVRKERISALLEQVNLKENVRTKVKALSGGMKRRLGIAQALLHNPQILIVDEPTAGLDPEERIRFRNLLSEFAEDRIVILSTHISSDVESSCENIGVLDNGRMIWSGGTEGLVKQAEGKVYLISAAKKKDKLIKEKYTVLNIIASGSGTQYRVLSDTPPEEKHILQDPTLEDGYMYLLSQTDGGINNEVISKRV
ncbi:MAG: ABC transporter ATP-binding protein [Clostridiales bacterium 45_37]|jgi:ABC-2 type transport system ATP-binding protein|nr:MAG: ABC transporter ATP-binding protein [Clostridiales bacterium 45_37]